jgi:hypothetical protein
MTSKSKLSQIDRYFSVKQLSFDFDRKGFNSLRCPGLRLARRNRRHRRRCRYRYLQAPCDDTIHRCARQLFRSLQHIDGKSLDTNLPLPVVSRRTRSLALDGTDFFFAAIADAVDIGGLSELAVRFVSRLNKNPTNAQASEPFRFFDIAADEPAIKQTTMKMFSKHKRKETTRDTDDRGCRQAR